MMNVAARLLSRRTLLREVPDLRQRGFSFVTLSTLLGQG